MGFIPDKFENMVLASELRCFGQPVLANPAFEIIRHADLQGSANPARKNVDAIVVVSRHHSTVAVTGSPGHAGG